MGKILTVSMGNEQLLELVQIPAGEFFMGSDAEDDPLCSSEETPLHTVTLDEFWMGRYPVTNQQYQRFLTQTGWKPPRLWKDGAYPPAMGSLPVVGVALKDARLFCYWLSLVRDKLVCLPGEAEWEKAARGIDGRIWPFGNQPLPVGRLKKLGKGEYQPAGSFSPDLDSPFGCADMGMNVGEWTSTLRQKGPLATFRYPYRMDDGRENALHKGERSVRGAAYPDYAPKKTRCAARSWAPPEQLSAAIGFRVMVTFDAGRWELAFPKDKVDRQRLDFDAGFGR